LENSENKSILFSGSSNILGKSVLFGVTRVSMGKKQLLKYVVLIDACKIGSGLL
jgi:hypothetical protein